MNQLNEADTIVQRILEGQIIPNPAFATVSKPWKTASSTEGLAGAGADTPYGSHVWHHRLVELSMQ
jgi:hypothetical protein